MQPSIKSLYHQYYRLLCLYALHYLGVNDVVEDIVQDCFVALWQQRPHHPRAFLYTAVRNRCINHLRRARPFIVTLEPHDLDGVITDDEARHRSDIEARLWQAIDQLPARQRQVLLMSKRDGMKYREIAHELQISERTVEHQVASAMKKMESLLRPADAEAARALGFLLAVLVV